MLITHLKSRSQLSSNGGFASHYGQLVLFDDEPQAVIVGDHELVEVDLTRFSKFIQNLVEQEERMAKLGRLNSNLGSQVQSMSIRVQKVLDFEARRAKLTDPQVENSIRSILLELTVRAMSCADGDEAMQTIADTASSLHRLLLEFAGPPPV